MLGDSKDQRSWTLWCTYWLSDCLRIAKDGAPLLAFSDWRQLPSMTDAVQAAGWIWREFVGVELSEEYFEIARHRLPAD